MGRFFVSENENEILLDRERENPKPEGLGVKGAITRHRYFI
jgi:hypothetical protein